MTKGWKKKKRGSFLVFFKAGSCDLPLADSSLNTFPFYMSLAHKHISVSSLSPIIPHLICP